MTTGIEDAGLLDIIIPVFEKETGYTTKIKKVLSLQVLSEGDQKLTLLLCRFQLWLHL